MSYELLLKERDELQREANTANAELFAVLKQSEYRSAEEISLDCMARMALEAQQAPIPEFPADMDLMRVKMTSVEDIAMGDGPDAQKRSRAAKRRIGDQPYEYEKLSQATTQLRQVEREIEGKDWTTKMVSELSKTLMDLKETLIGTQNKAAEIEIGSALHKHVVSSVQNAEVLEGGTDTARVDRLKMTEALDLALKSVADRRSEMMLDDIGHGDIESWIAKWEDRMNKDAADVMAAARALDERMRIEADVQLRFEKEIDSVEVMVDGKEQFVRKMNDIRARTLQERDGLAADQKRYDNTRGSLEQVFLQKHGQCEQKLLEVRTRKAECRERLDQYREELVRIMHAIKSENASVNTLCAIEAEVLNIEQDNQRVKAAMGSSLQELKTGQALMSKDLNAKVRSVELALARGCNILDAVMTRKHERETELDSKSRDMYIQHHDACVNMYRHFAHILADKEDKRDQLIETLETLKYQFEQAVKIANFSEIGRVKDLMKRVDADLARVHRDIEEGAAVLYHRYRMCWDLERVLYQRFRYTDAASPVDDVNLEMLAEEANAAPPKFESTTTWVPRPKPLDAFFVMRIEPNILKNPQFNEGRSGWSGNDCTELALRESADHQHYCVARATASNQGILLQQRDVAVDAEREYLLNVRSAMANAERVLSLFVERQDAQGSRLLAQKSVQMSPGLLQVGLKLRFCTGPTDRTVRVCVGMKAEPGDELTVGQVLLLPLQFVEIVNPQPEVSLRRVEEQMLREDEKDKRERAKIREQQRKRQTLLDQRDTLEQQRLTYPAGVSINSQRSMQQTD
eukprot:CAMPEP_0206256554 /NCGR_PEP_ID=MMETSP0047_2-20121206/24839_1 /ASSEMBLY_ACC=CAM_ASM_000192 /TAXON_ID=195065 /ORGANISM="Chroomonas mesostigmatica_cf, Strain CCMP1168" /LENGTH=802 /DNA_ID=CAMNT_0053683021 /DNA_START=107 /DNA_END=2515 /DNA_ORIENTATION=+